MDKKYIEELLDKALKRAKILESMEDCAFGHNNTELSETLEELKILIEEENVL